MLNQLLSGHTLLHSHRAKINRTVSELCETCLCTGKENFVTVTRVSHKYEKQMIILTQSVSL